MIKKCYPFLEIKLFIVYMCNASICDEKYSYK